jgi:hypothetical protein
MRRFTIDLDTRSIRELWRTLSRSRYCLRLTWKELINHSFIRLSRKKGYHIHILYDWDIPKRMELLYRVYCGDDPKRVYLDMTRKQAPTNVLFNADAGRILWVGKKWRAMK